MHGCAECSVDHHFALCLFVAGFCPKVTRQWYVPQLMVLLIMKEKCRPAPATPPKIKNKQSSMTSFFSPLPKQEQNSPAPDASQDSPMPPPSSQMKSASREQYTREQFVAWGKKGGRPKKTEECRFKGQSPQKQYNARKESAKSVILPLQRKIDAAVRVTVVGCMKSRRHEFGKGPQEEAQWLMACRKEKFSQFSISKLRSMLQTYERDSSGNTFPS
jgi:hypothetical protein